MQLDSPSTEDNRMTGIRFRSFGADQRISERASIDVVVLTTKVVSSSAGLLSPCEQPVPNPLLTFRHVLTPTQMRPQTCIINELLVFVSFPRSLIPITCISVTSVVQEGPWKQLHYQDHEPYVSVDADAPLRVFP